MKLNKQQIIKTLTSISKTVENTDFIFIPLIDSIQKAKFPENKIIYASIIVEPLNKKTSENEELDLSMTAEYILFNDYFDKEFEEVILQAIEDIKEKTFDYADISLLYVSNDDTNSASIVIEEIDLLKIYSITYFL